MPTFLSDPPLSVYLLLVVAVLIAGAAWLNRRDRRSLGIFLGVIVLATLVSLLDFLLESPREEAVRRATEMAKAAEAKNPEAFMAHMADTVEFRTGSQPITIRRDAMKASSFWGMLKQYDPRIVVWDFSRTEVKEINADTIQIGFMAKGVAQGKPYPIFMRATFTRQADGQMKLSACQTFNPVNHNEPLVVPNFP
jgi:hypothetical protein